MVSWDREAWNNLQKLDANGWVEGYGVIFGQVSTSPGGPRRGVKETPLWVNKNELPYDRGISCNERQERSVSNIKMWCLKYEA